MKLIAILAAFIFSAHTDPPATHTDQRPAAHTDQRPMGEIINSPRATHEELVRLAIFLGAPVYGHVPDATVFGVENDRFVRLSTRRAAVQDERLEAGIYWNATGADVWLDVEDQDRVRVPRGALIAVGDSIEGLKIAANGTGIDCEPGYFACCQYGQSRPRAFCHRSSDRPFPHCDAGGPGAQGCTIEQGGLRDDPEFGEDRPVGSLQWWLIVFEDIELGAQG